MDAGRADLTVRSIATSPEPITWTRQWYAADGRLQLGAATSSQGYILRFPGIGDFVISERPGMISYRRDPTAAAASFRHALLDQVIPRALAQSGRLVLHASAVCGPTGALCLAGSPRQGKSTLAAALHHAGLASCADDAVLVDLAPEGPVCWPAYPGVRVCTDSAAYFARTGPPVVVPTQSCEKLRLLYDAPVRTAVPEPIPLCGILILDRREPSNANTLVAIRLTDLSASQVAACVMTHMFKLDIKDRLTLSGMLAQVAALANALPVLRLEYPSGYEHLPVVCEHIRSFLASCN